MNNRLIIVLNWICLLLIVVMLVASRRLGWNTYALDAAASRNLFLPAAYSFGIWNFIAALLAGFAIRTTDLLWGPGKAASGLGKLARQVSPWFWVSSVLLAGWFLAWKFEIPSLAILLMILLLISLLRIFFYIQYSPAPLTYLEHVTLETPFVVFFSWITFLTVSHIASFFALSGWEGGSLKATGWSYVLIALTTAIAVWLSKKRPAYSMVMIWAFIGLGIRVGNSYPLMLYVIIAACLVCAIASAIGFWARRKVLFGE